jgi:hypothetical protein
MLRGKKNILVLHVDHRSKEIREEQTYLGNADVTHRLTLAKRVAISQTIKRRHNQQLCALAELLTKLEGSGYFDIPPGNEDICLFLDLRERHSK